MIRHYVGPIAQGVGIFALVVMVLAVPYLIWQYRRQGTVKPRRALVHATFVLYLICAWALGVAAPADPASLRHPVPANLVPFQWWTDMMNTLATSGGGWRALLTNGPLLVRVFNVALTVPLGIYLRRWWQRGLIVTAVAGFGLSLAFELTQLTALWGLYPMPYRSFDVDDLIANTAGAPWAGCWLRRWCCFRGGVAKTTCPWWACPRCRADCWRWASTVCVGADLLGRAVHRRQPHPRRG